MDRLGGDRNCADLLASWDPMFARTVDPTRYHRLEAIIGHLEEEIGGQARVLELGCGPGTLVKRVLRRFPRSFVVALDYDPVLLEIGKSALDPFRGRARWVLADLRKEHWPSELPVRPYDAVVSSLVLHWLEESDVRRIYRWALGLLRPSGVMINGDYLPRTMVDSRANGERVSRGTDHAVERTSRGVRAFKTAWARWWMDVEANPSLRTALRRRSRLRLGPIPPRRPTGPEGAVPLESPRRAMRAAGFREVGVCWEERPFRVLVGKA